MTIARAHLVHPAVSRWYHCVTRCVRRALLLGKGAHDRKEWNETRLRELAVIFSVAVGGFSVLDNYPHALVACGACRTWPDALHPDVATGEQTLLEPEADRLRRAPGRNATQGRCTFRAG
jgi:hypothetical protein